MATLTTPQYGFPYPDGTERVADGDNAIGALALAVENRLLLPPAEQTANPALTSGWINFGAPLGPVRYIKDANGFVHLDGAMKSGTIGAIAFTLPAGFRPSSDTRFPVVSNSLFGVCIVTASGGVNPFVGNNASFVLDGVTFRAGG